MRKNFIFNSLAKLAPYCKQLYLDVTNSNQGKITWKLLKPIIQGKIIFGPVNGETKEIMTFANKTFEEMSRLREFFGAIATSIKMLKTNKEFRANFDNLLNLAKSPFVQAILGGAVDLPTIENVLDSIINDKQVFDVIDTVGNIFDCFSADRFVGVKDEKELEEVAFEMAKKKLFYAGVYFTNDFKTNKTSYKLRMEVDNSPKTIENKNRFWFPGPEGSFELEMRYHRGFVQIQNSIDTAIIKYYKKKQFNEGNKAEPPMADDLAFGEDSQEDFSKDLDVKYEDDDDFGGLELDHNGEIGDAEDSTTTEGSTSGSTTQAPEINLGDIFKTIQDKLNISSDDVEKYSDDGDFWDFEDEAPVTNAEGATDSPPTTVDEMLIETTTTEATTQPEVSRKKRQLESIFSMFSFGGDEKSDKKELKYDVDDMKFHTRQFPYPKYTRDDFKKGL